MTRALRGGGNAVLVAPPGAGKTTCVPLALLDEDWTADKTIVMLEPRRVATRAAAERMAQMRGEPAGVTVGYRIRGESAISAETRIQVVTEGILTRRLQSDPGLEGVAAVIFDEVHERSIHADLGLALCLDLQGALRPDLRLLAMSATLEDERMAALMNAPVIRSEGRMFPVETHWLDTPWRKPGGARHGFERAVADLTIRAFDEQEGDALVFLPGAGEIERVRAALSDYAARRGIDIRPLHGSLPFTKQRQALAPAQDGRRRVVLASAIAETSLTVAGVRIVVDGGLSRRAVFDPGSGMTRLVTGPVSKASAEQRRGRAGRTEPGACYRLWTKGQEGGFAPVDSPEIAQADLAPLALEIALWGVRDPADLRWLDPPPDAAFAEARALLTDLAALDGDGRPTERGAALAVLPLHPRLGHLLLEGRTIGAGRLAADLAALLEDRDPLRGAGADLTARIEALRGRECSGTADPGTLARARETAKRLRQRVDDDTALGPLGTLVTLAYPDRIAQRRPGEAPRYVMSGGKGAVFADPADPLSADPYLALAHLDGDPREARIRLAAPVTRAQIEAAHADRIVKETACVWDARQEGVLARRRSRLGALILEDRPWRNVPPEAVAAAAADGVRALGLDTLPWEGAAERLRGRVRWLRDQGGVALPDWSDNALLESLDDWLTPHLGMIRRRGDFDMLDLHGVLLGALQWQQRESLDRLAPTHLETPAGNRAPIDYSGERPALDVRIQEMFGTTEHPAIGGGRTPLLVRLLSPARRPVQITADLPGFWADSYTEVRKEMRGRYPRHPWPEDPRTAPATTRAKPRRR